MTTLIRAALVVAALGLAGCDAPSGTLKGRVVDGGKPVGSDGKQVALSFHPMKADGTADATNAYIAVLNGDGSFEFVASGGTLPPGQYRVVIAAAQSSPPVVAKGKKALERTVDRFAGHSTLAASKLTVTVQAGVNDLVVDLAKPAG